MKYSNLQKRCYLFHQLSKTAGLIKFPSQMTQVIVERSQSQFAYQLHEDIFLNSNNSANQTFTPEEEELRNQLLSDIKFPDSFQFSLPINLSDLPTNYPNQLPPDFRFKRLLVQFNPQPPVPGLGKYLVEQNCLIVNIDKFIQLFKENKKSKSPLENYYSWKGKMEDTCQHEMRHFVQDVLAKLRRVHFNHPSNFRALSPTNKRYLKDQVILDSEEEVSLPFKDEESMMMVGPEHIEEDIKSHLDNVKAPYTTKPHEYDPLIATTKLYFTQLHPPQQNDYQSTREMFLQFVGAKQTTNTHAFFESLRLLDYKRWKNAAKQLWKEIEPLILLR